MVGGLRGETAQHVQRAYGEIGEHAGLVARSRNSRSGLLSGLEGEAVRFCGLWHADWNRTSLLIGSRGSLPWVRAYAARVNAVRSAAERHVDRPTEAAEVT
jgi:hypothetical protein